MTCADATVRYTSVGADNGAVIVYNGASGARECAFKPTGYGGPRGVTCPTRDLTRVHGSFPATGICVRDDVIVTSYASGASARAARVAVQRAPTSCRSPLPRAMQATFVCCVRRLAASWWRCVCATA